MSDDNLPNLTIRAVADANGNAAYEVTSERIANLAQLETLLASVYVGIAQQIEQVAEHKGVDPRAMQSRIYAKTQQLGKQIAQQQFIAQQQDADDEKGEIEW